MKTTFQRRALSLLLCFSLVLGCTAYRPQKASAVVTETAIALGLASLIPYAISTGMDLSATSGGADAIAMGISELWDSFYARWQETDATIKRSAEDELAYIGGQIMPTYKNGALTLSDYVVGVYDKFVQWLIGEKGVTGGDAVEVAKSTGGFSVSSCSTSYAWCGGLLIPFLKQDAMLTTDLIRSLGVNDKFAVLAMSDMYFIRFYFNSDGIFCTGVFYNPYEAVHSSYFGLYDVSSLELVSALNVSLQVRYGDTYDLFVFYDKSYAESYRDFLTSSCFAFDWSQSFYYSSTVDAGVYAWYKESVDSIFGASSSSYFLFPGEQFLFGSTNPFSIYCYLLQ